MRADPIRHQFASDNTAAICPEAWKALEEANAQFAPSYGEDEWTAAVFERIRQLFEVDCDVYLVFTGTAANALGLAQVCQPFHGVICHERAHIQTDEAGAISIAQATELGTVYTTDEVDAIGAFARANRMLLHMDGARFANAVASLGCAPKAITSKAGVDVLRFGGTKNGVGVGELVIFFDKTASRD